MPFFNYHHFNICVLFTVLFWPGLFSFCGGFSDFKRRSKLQFHCRHATRPRLTCFFFLFFFTLASKISKYNKTGGTQSLSLGNGKRKEKSEHAVKIQMQQQPGMFLIYLFIYFFFFLFAFRWCSTWNSIEKQSSGTLFPNFRQGQLFFFYFLFFVYSEKVLLLFPLIRLLVLLLLARL